MGDEPNTMKPASAEQAVFAEAFLRGTPKARAAYIEAACGTDTALRHRVEALLRAAENAVVLAPLFGVVASTWQAVRASKAEQAATLEGKRAEQQAQLAAQEATRATAEATRASAVATAARRYAYAAEINVALQALAENNLSRARELLDRQQPKAGEEYLRGFEWRYLWRLCQGDEIATFRDERAEGAAFSADGKTFATASADRTVNLWEAGTFKHLARLRGHGGEVWSLAFSPDSRTLVSGSAEGTTKLWSADTRHHQMLESSNILLGFIGDGRSMIAATSKAVSVWTPDSGARVDFPIPTNPPIGSVTLPPFHVKPDEPLAAFGRSDGTVELWHLETGVMGTGWPAHKVAIGVVAFSPDGKTLATASLDNDARLWDLPAGKLRATLSGHVGGVIAVAFSPDGKTLATGSHDGTVKLWDVATHQELATFTLGGLFPTLGFSPDGRMLAVGNAFEARIQVVRAPSFEEIQAATKRGADARVAGTASAP